MTYIQWSPDLSVKVKELDEHHQVLIAMINDLHQAMLAHAGREAQKTIVAKMLRYAQLHFASEEKYMSQFAFPGLHSHRAEHDKFTAKAKDLNDRLDKAGFVLTLEILNFLRDWLKNHIMGTARLYSQHFNQHGLS